MVTTKKQTLSWLIFLLLDLKVYGEEINGTLTFMMTWDEEQDRLTHDVRADLGDGVVDVSSGYLHGNDWNISLPKRKNLSRVRRNVLDGNYVRHGPSCLVRQMDILVDETPQEGKLTMGAAVHVAMLVTHNEEAQMTCHYCDPEESAGGKSETKEEKNKRKKSQLWYKLNRKNRPWISEYYQLNEVALDMFDDETRNRVFVTEAHSLVIRKATQRDAGTYICRDMTKEDRFMKPELNASEIAKMFEADDKLRFMYHLDVLDLNDHRKVIMVTTNKDFKTDVPLATPDVQVPEMNVEIFTFWEEWSPCSSCDQPGTRRRLGVCKVKKIDHSKPSVHFYLNIMLTIYKDGILCRSSAFYTRDKLHILAARPGDELEEVVCNVTCTNFSIKMTDLVSSVPTTVKIEAFILNEGEAVSLECPKAPLDMPVAWINGTKVLIRQWLKSQTDGRVSIDVNNTFHISHLELTDAGHYLCVVAGRVLGHVMLGVEPVPPEVVIWRYAWYLMYSYPFDFFVFLILLYVRHVQRKKVLNYDVLPDPDDMSSDSGSSASDINVNRNINNSNLNFLTAALPTALTATTPPTTAKPILEI